MDELVRAYKLHEGAGQRGRVSSGAAGRGK